jgi:hypothetical protein
MEKSATNETIGIDKTGACPDTASGAMSPSCLPDGPFLLQKLLTCEGGLMKGANGVNIVSIEKVDVQRVDGGLDPWAPKAIENLLSKWLVRAYARRYNDDTEEGPARLEEVSALAHSRI